MKPLTFMLIAGEPSGDLLGAELVRALQLECARQDGVSTPDLQPLRTGLAPQCFGAGGPKMAAAGVDLAFDLTAHSVVGLWEVIRNYGQFKKLFHRLLALAQERQPDVLICVDFSGFNRRFAHALRRQIELQRGSFNNWHPRIVQYVSPQVWASRPGRAKAMARDFDLIVSLFPFEKEWYAQYAPELRVEFVGHPIMDRHGNDARGQQQGEGQEQQGASPDIMSQVLLLPGSRAGELRRHLPVMVEAARQMLRERPLGLRMILPNEALAGLARPYVAPLPGLKVQTDGLAAALAQADLAIASTGTVTLECAYFGVPTVALYRTAWSNYLIAKRLIRVSFLAMPNLLAGEAIFPELLQHDATAENIAREALELLRNEARRAEIKTKLAKAVSSLGQPGASQRAAQAVLKISGMTL